MEAVILVLRGAVREERRGAHGRLDETRGVLSELGGMPTEDCCGANRGMDEGNEGSEGMSAAMLGGGLQRKGNGGGSRTVSTAATTTRATKWRFGKEIRDGCDGARLPERGNGASPGEERRPGKSAEKSVGKSTGKSNAMQCRVRAVKARSVFGAAIASAGAGSEKRGRTPYEVLVIGTAIRAEIDAMGFGRAALRRRMDKDVLEKKFCNAIAFEMEKCL